MDGLSSVVVAVLGVLTAVIGYRTAVRESAKTATKQLSVVSLDDPSVAVRPWRFSRVLGIVGGFSAIYVLGIAVISQDLSLTAAGLVGAVIGLTPMFLARKTPPSRTIKRAELVVSARADEAVKHAVDALSSIGAKIGKVDANSAGATIVARTGMNWRTWGEILTIRVSPENTKAVRILIESDHVNPGALFDLGANARNIARLKDYLIQSG